MLRTIGRWLRNLLVACGLVGLAIAVPCLVVPLWRYHLFNVFSRAEQSFLQSIGTTGLGFHAAWAIPVLSFIASLVLVRRQRGRDAMLTHWQEAGLALRVLLIAMFLYFVPIFCWNFVKVTYNDHQSLAIENTIVARANADLRLENEQLKNKRCQPCGQSSPKSADANQLLRDTTLDLVRKLRELQLWWDTENERIGFGGDNEQFRQFMRRNVGKQVDSKFQPLRAQAKELKNELLKKLPSQEPNETVNMLLDTGVPAGVKPLYEIADYFDQLARMLPK